MCICSFKLFFLPSLSVSFHYIMLYIWDVCFFLLLGYPDKFWRIRSRDWLWYIDNWWWRRGWRPQDSASSVSSQCFILDIAYFFLLLSHYPQQKKHSILVIITNLNTVYYINPFSMTLKVLDPNITFQVPLPDRSPLEMEA